MQLLPTRRNGAQAFAILALLLAAATQIQIRSRSTLLGYKLGQLKEQEAKLIDERSQLRLQLAKMTTKEHLSLISTASKGSTSDAGELAAR